MKACNACGETKPITDFSIDRKTKDGYNFYCKRCCNEKQKIYRGTPAGVYNAIKSRQSYYHRHEMKQAKPFEINKEEFISWYESQPKFCVYCDIPEELIYLLDGIWGQRKTKLEVDCMENELGYIDGNIVLACKDCNTVKNSVLLYDEMMIIGQQFMKAKWIKRAEPVINYHKRRNTG